MSLHRGDFAVHVVGGGTADVDIFFIAFGFVFRVYAGLAAGVGRSAVRTAVRCCRSTHPRWSIAMPRWPATDVLLKDWPLLAAVCL